MGKALITGPAELPVTLAEARTMCRVDGTDHDDRLSLLIAGAAGYAETMLGRALGEQVWEVTFDAFADTLALVPGPVSAVEWVRYVDLDGLEQEVDAESYTVDLLSDPQSVVRNADATWPDTLDTVNAVSVRFATGAPTTPATIKQALLVLIDTWFDKGADATVPAFVASVLWNLRACP